MYIQIEGTEASGKSTLIKKFKQDYGFIVSDTVEFPNVASSYGFLARQHLDSKEVLKYMTLKTRSMMITLLSICDQQEWRSDNNLLLVSSRGILSTIVYSSLSDSKVEEAVINLIDYIPKPDLIVYIQPPIKILTERLSLRDKDSSIYDKVELTEQIIHKYHECMFKYQNILPPILKFIGEDAINTNKMIDKILYKTKELTNDK